MNNNDALREALDLIDQIVLAGMSGSGQESEEGMRDFHARQAWNFISIAARAKEKLREALPASKPEPQAQAGEPEVVAWMREWEGDVSDEGNTILTDVYEDTQDGKEWAQLITLQSHREAMETADRVIVQYVDLTNEQGEAISKKDAALKACVEALEHHTEQTRPIYKTQHAIAQAQEAMK